MGNVFDSDPRFLPKAFGSTGTLGGTTLYQIGVNFSVGTSYAFALLDQDPE